MLQVRAHYSAVSSLPCPALDELCNGADCTQLSSSSLTGALPSPGWCLHQWQKNIPKHHTTVLQLGWEITHSVRVHHLWSDWSLTLCSLPSDPTEPCHCIHERICLSEPTLTMLTSLRMWLFLLQSGERCFRHPEILTRTYRVSETCASLVSGYKLRVLRISRWMWWIWMEMRFAAVIRRLNLVDFCSLMKSDIFSLTIFAFPCWKIQHMLVRYVLKHGCWFTLVECWS